MGNGLALILDNVRSAHNVGVIFRSGDAFGVKKIICTGITPYPRQKSDARLPHVFNKATIMITKTALGAEKTVPFEHYKTAQDAIDELKRNNYHIYALEQAEGSIRIDKFKPDFPCALIIGNEVDGIDERTLRLADKTVEIPMLGQKESLNVAVAASIALYQLTKGH